MSNVLLKLCTGCGEYTLSTVCPRCGQPAKPNRPAKYSPEDNYGEYRRKLKKLDAAKGPGKSDSERVARAPAATPPPTKPPSPPSPAIGAASPRTTPPSATSAPSVAPSGRKPKGA